MNYEHLTLTVYKSGKTYKPMIRVMSGNRERYYKLFTASAEGFQTRERAFSYGESQLKAGRFL